MNTPRIAAIEQLLLDLAAALKRKPDLDWCAEFRLATSGDEPPWIQVTDTEINFRYPFDVDPVTKLVGLPTPPLPGMFCTVWQPNAYATLDLVEEGDVHWLAKFIDSLLTNLYHARPADELQTEIVEL